MYIAMLIIFTFKPIHHTSSCPKSFNRAPSLATTIGYNTFRMGGNAKVFALHGGNHGQTFFSSHLYAFKEKKSIAL